MFAMFNVTHTMFRIWGPVADRADSHQPQLIEAQEGSQRQDWLTVSSETHLLLSRSLSLQVEHAVPEAHGVGKTR